MLLALVLAIYGPDVGHGFIQDDFAWILHARSEGILDAIDRAFTTSLGFFRPIVTLSFALNEWTFGLQPLGYGATNLLLAMACMFALARLAARVGLGPGYALLAAGVWALNFHGINMSVLWISARSSLLATLFALLAAHACESRRRLLAGVWTMLALLSKEEVVLLPVVLALWRLMDTHRWRRALLDSWPLFVALAAYAVLRTQSGAFTPATAPEFYRFTVDPAHLARNLIEYVARSGMTGAIVVVALALAASPSLWPSPPDPLSAGAGARVGVRGVVIKGALWWIGGFAVTMWLPVRSSLYAVLPSVGVALMVGACAASLESSLPLPRRRALVVAGFLLPLLLLPVYRARNVRWASMAEVSAMTLARAQALLPGLPDRAVIALIDVPDVRANFTNTFGSMAPAASQLFLERGVELAIDPPPDESRPRRTLHLEDLDVR